MIIGGLAGAIAWSSLCTYFGLPISNSHSLIGGIMGAGIAGLGFEQLVLGGLTKVFAGIIIAPIGGMIFGIALAGAIIVFLAKRRPAIVNRTFGRLQIISSAWFALTHGQTMDKKLWNNCSYLVFGKSYRRNSYATLGNLCSSGCNGFGYILWRIQSNQNTWSQSHQA